MQNAADIDFHVFDTCAASGKPMIGWDNSYNLRGRARLDTPNIGGKCLQMCVYGYNVPAGQTRTVYSADYFHSGNTAFH
jgi:hypothetical protein